MRPRNCYLRGHFTGKKLTCGHMTVFEPKFADNFKRLMNTQNNRVFEPFSAEREYSVKNYGDIWRELS